MLDIVLAFGGVIAVAAGLWLVYPPAALVVAGGLAIVVAYGRYKANAKEANVDS